MACPRQGHGTVGEAATMRLSFLGSFDTFPVSPRSNFCLFPPWPPKSSHLSTSKAGSAKPSNVVNLGACLAQHHRKRVLIVDLDPQANSTFWLLRPSDWEVLDRDHRRSSVQIFSDAVNGTSHFDFQQSVVCGVPRSERGFSQIETLDLLPTTVELLEAEISLIFRENKNGERYFDVLANRLRPRLEEYDYVLLDCPPNLYPVAQNALCFADYYLVPYIPDYLSLSGLRMLARLIRRFEKDNVTLSARLAGVIVNRYKKQGNIFTDAINELKLELGDLRAKGLVHDRADLLAPPIRDCVGLAECSNFHLPVIIHSEDALSSKDYGELAVAFMQHIDVTLSPSSNIILT